jgi:hypothetical protein
MTGIRVTSSSVSIQINNVDVVSKTRFLLLDLSRSRGQGGIGGDLRSDSGEWIYLE